MQSTLQPETRSHAVGTRAPLLEAKAFASGRARYTVDMSMPGMLHCKVLYSKFPHARILGIDMTAALQLPGVSAIITAADIDEERNVLGLSVSDRPVFAHDKVRSVADVLAAVAAVDEATAQRAVDLIQVTYEQLPTVSTIEEALRDGAPLLHERKATYKSAPYVTAHMDLSANNVSTHLHLTKGDVAAARSQAHLVVRERFHTQRIEQFHMEPHAAIASYDQVLEKMTVWCSTGKPYRLLSHLVECLGMPQTRVNLITPPCGGDFGGKGEITVELYCALLSIKTGRPVRAIYTREEEFIASTCKVPFDVEMEIGVDREGRLLFMDAGLILECGAYNGLTTMVSIHGTTHLEGPYYVPNIDIDTRCVYTNNVVSGAFRGFGAPQVSFGREILLDEIARRLGMDPLELRLKNAWEAGAVNCTGQVLSADRYSVSIKETIETAMAHTVYADRAKPADGNGRVRRGIGVAAGHQGVGGGIWTGADVATAYIKANQDGTFSMTVGVADVGQGPSTALVQIVAEVLGVPVSAVNLPMLRETDVVPYHGGASASRQLYTSGNASCIAANNMREKLLSIASEMLETEADDLECYGGEIFVKGAPARSVTIAKLVGYSMSTKGGQPVVVGSFSGTIEQLDPKMHGAPFQTFDYATQVAEVEVDTETGEVRVLKLLTVQDVGKAINMMIVEGQSEGGAVQAIGYALMEEIVCQDGQVLNPYAFDYRLPRMGDIGELVTVILEHPDPRGPLGAKGAGEISIVPAAAAIANAIYDAVGVRLTSLPMVPERVYQAMQQHAAGKRG